MRIEIFILLIALLYFFILVILALLSVVLEQYFPRYKAIWDKVEGRFDGDYNTYKGYEHNKEVLK